MSRVVAEVHWDAERPFQVIPEVPEQAREIGVLDLEHDLTEERDPTTEVNQIFDKAVALQSRSARPIVVSVEDTQVRFFDQR